MMTCLYLASEEHMDIFGVGHFLCSNTKDSCHRRKIFIELEFYRLMSFMGGGELVIEHINTQSLTFSVVIVGLRLGLVWFGSVCVVVRPGGSVRPVRYSAAVWCGFESGGSIRAGWFGFAALMYDILWKIYYFM